MKTQPSGLLSWSSLSLNNVKYFYRLNINLDNDIVLDDYNSFNQMDQIFNKWLEKNQNNLNKICDELIKI